jgi:hypothetical protein
MDALQRALDERRAREGSCAPASCNYCLVSVPVIAAPFS